MTAAFKNEQIYFLLQQKILNGELACGARLPAEELLAKELHVGRVTLRSALKRLDDQQFIRRVRGQGTFVIYSPDESPADNVIFSEEEVHVKHKLLLLVSKEGFRSSSLEICSGVLAQAAEKNVEIQQMDYEFFRKCVFMKKAEELLEREYITGIILPFHGFIGNEPEVDFFKLLKIPVLLPFPWDSDIFLNVFKTFDAPSRSAMYAILRYLNNSGHRKIAFVGPFGSKDLHLLSEQEYRFFTDCNGDWFIAVPPEPEAIHAAVCEYLKVNQATVIFCYDSIYAFSVVETLKKLHLRIPDDISVVEFADSSRTSFHDPALLFCDLKLMERGRAAVDYLTGKPIDEQIGFELIKNNSVKVITNQTKKGD